MTLDKRCKRLLDAVIRICGEDGAYKIIEKNDLRNEMLPRYKIDIEMLEQMIKFLVATDMIDIKHDDENVYCIAILPKGRVYEEQQQKTKENRVIGKGLAFFIIFGSFLASIVGAAVASVIIHFLG